MVRPRIDLVRAANDIDGHNRKACERFAPMAVVDLLASPDIQAVLNLLLCLLLYIPALITP